MSDPVQILVVDDEAPQVQAICDTLSGDLYQPVGFSSSRAALEAVQPGRFSLLLTDLMMPGMDGISLLQAALAKDPDLIGIVMTGAGTIATAVEAMKAGAFDYMLKPFRLSVMLPVLSRALAVRKLRIENAALQQRVREQTAELEETNNDLEAFAYSVSHDLNAPLRAIAGFTSVLIEDRSLQLPDEAKRMLGRISANSQRMGRLIEDLLRFSRIGRQAIPKVPVSISSLVKEVLEEQGVESDQRKVDIRIGDLPDCLGDPALLKQIYANLLSNAFKYTTRTQSAVIEIGSSQEHGECVYFVRDNGAGFDSKKSQGLFGVFVRLHKDDEFPGNGIGLSIVKRIVQHHGGRIWAEAEVGKGATFLFTLASGQSAASKGPP